jgi:pilus assembly protein CpaC
MFNLTIDAANDQQLAKILAQPTLTTLSGQPATFISGGEFPIPVPQTTGSGSGTITIQFKEFGIGLKFVPVVLDSGRINLNMNVSVSELSQDAAVIAQAGNTNTQFAIPSLTKREASSTLELADGQTMSIAGLISDKLRENVNKFPGLGDIPGLGALFRSSKFQNDQSELVIFVTPRLAKPVLAQNAQLPTDSFVKPDDVDFYVLGRTESRKTRNRWVKNDASPMGNKGGLDGEYGQQLMEGAQ